MASWVAGCALLGLGGVFLLANWMVLVECLRKRGHISMIPLGGPLAFAGCAVVPAIGWRLGLVSLALDPWMVAMAAWPIVATAQLVWRRVRGRR